MDGITDLYNMDGLLIVLSGPSGVGKGTICKELIRVCPDLKMSVSVTTRPPRQGEVEGIHYLFRTEEEFKELIEKEQLLEYAHVFESAYYGTPKNYVFNMLQQGHDVLLEIDVVGAKQVRGNFPRAISIFVVPPSLYELERRLRERGTEKCCDMESRLETARKELEYIRDYDYIVVNDDVEKATEQIKTIITTEKCRVENNREMILHLTRRA
ncbi:MAG: guanylate kinase [Christensenellales bacterium]|jgi:guanylate kinase